jgi:HK97 family phage prohead protease
MQDLIRMVGVDASELRASADGRTLFGYPIVFNQPTRIRSWEGDFIETIAPGATKKTLRDNGNSIKVLFNHGMDPSIGNKPLGKPKIQREEAKGLYTETPLSDTSYNVDLAALIRDGAIDGMSFRFGVIQDTWNQKPGRSKTNPDGVPERTITELKLVEYGPVTFPAYQATEIGLRSLADNAAWQGLDPEKRAEVQRILGMTSSTPDPEAGDATSEQRAADTTTAQEPVVTATRTLAIAAQQARALLLSKGITSDDEVACSP